MNSQTSWILRDLTLGFSISPIEALARYGCMRLGARIWELKQKGYVIKRTMVKDPVTGKRYARYWREMP